MNTINKSWGGEAADPWVTLGGGSFADAFGGEPQPGPAHLLRAFRGTAYAVVDLVATKTAQIITEHIQLAVTNKGGSERFATGSIKSPYKIRQKYKRFCTKAENILEVLDHPLLERLYKPNQATNMTFFQLIKGTLTHLDLCGHSFWHVKDVGLGQLSDITLMLPQKVEVLRDENGDITGYRNGHREGDVIYPPEDIVHFMYFDPTDPYGNSNYVCPIQAVWLELMLQFKEISSWDALVSNLAEPRVIISPKDSDGWSKEEAEINSKMWQQHYQGNRRGGPWFPTAPVDMNIPQYPPKDLAGLQLNESLKKSICNVIHVPTNFLDQQESSWASSDVSEMTVQRHCYQPRITNFTETITTSYAQRNYGPRLFFVVSDFEIEDKEYKLKEKQSDLADVQAGVMTENEYRTKWGLPAKEGGDELRKPVLDANTNLGDAGDGGDVFSDQADEADQPEIDKPEHQADATASNDLRATVGGSQAVLQIQQSYYAGTVSYEAARANLHLVFGFSEQEAAALLSGAPEKQTEDDTPDPKKPQVPPLKSKSKDKLKLFAKVLQKYYQHQRAEVLGGLKSLSRIHTKAVPDKPWYDLAEYTDAMAKDLLPIVQFYYEASASKIARRLGFDSSIPKVVNQKVPEAARNAVLAFCESTNNSTSERLGKALEDTRKAVQEGLEHGSAMNELSQKVNEIFDGLTVEHSYLIARTEANRAQYAAEKMTIDESGHDVKKKWLSETVMCCDRCKALDGKVLPMDEPFYVDPKGGPYAVVMHPVLHPLCRCTLEYEVD